MRLDTEKIKRLREKANLSLQQAAERAGMTHRQNWHSIENGKVINVTIATICNMARAIGAKPKDLLTDD